MTDKERARKECKGQGRGQLVGEAQVSSWENRVDDGVLTEMRKGEGGADL